MDRVAGAAGATAGPGARQGSVAFKPPTRARGLRPDHRARLRDPFRPILGRRRRAGLRRPARAGLVKAEGGAAAAIRYPSPSPKKILGTTLASDG